MIDDGGQIRGAPIVEVWRMLQEPPQRRRPVFSRGGPLGVRRVHADFGSEAGILAFIDALKAQTSQLRAIVHNASAWIADSAGDEAAAFQQMVNVHMLAPYLINLHCADLLADFEARQAAAADDDDVALDQMSSGAWAHPIPPLRRTPAVAG